MELELPETMEFHTNMILFWVIWGTPMLGNLHMHVILWSQILDEGFSIINHPATGVPPFMETPNWCLVMFSHQLLFDIRPRPAMHQITAFG